MTAATRSRRAGRADPRPRHVTPDHRLSPEEASSRFAAAASPAARADILSSIKEVSDDDLIAVGAILHNALVTACGQGAVSLDRYARRGEDRRPIDAWIAKQDLYHFHWWAVDRTNDQGRPGPVMQVLSAADETTRQTHRGALRAHQCVLGSTLTGDGPGSHHSPRFRLKIDLLQAWHANGMVMKDAADALSERYSFSDDRWQQARVERLAVIGRLPAADISDGVAWILRHAGPEPEPPKHGYLYSDWHVQVARERDAEHALDVLPYRRDHRFLAVVSGVSAAMRRHGSPHVARHQREQLAALGLALCAGSPIPQQVSSAADCAAVGAVLLGSLAATHRDGER
jgi:hypothetical protein